MEMILLFARLLLAAVFGIAGIAKFNDRQGTERALQGFGVPEIFIKPLAWILPGAEIGVALALLPHTTAWLGSIGALFLLTVFVVAISFNLARGNAPDCHCFGQLHSEPVSWSVLSRNLGLAAVALFLVAQGQDHQGLSAISWMKEMRTGEAISLILSLLAVVFLLPVYAMLRRALRQQDAMSETLTTMRKLIEEDYGEPQPLAREDASPPVEGLPVGAVAPGFTFPTLIGKEMSLDGLLSFGKPVLLLFVSPTCSPCRTLLPHVRTWDRDYGDFLTIALLSKGTEKEVRNKLAKYAAPYVLLHENSTIAEDYQTRWTPAAVLVDRNGKIASPVTAGQAAIQALVTHTVTTASAAQSDGATARPLIKVGKSLFNVGEPAPRFTLADVDGQHFSLDGLLGQQTLLLFWNPGCGYCKAMADDLMRWENQPSAIRVVFISSGEAAEVKKESQRFRSLFLHDEDFEIGPLFGASGTPSAVLLDETGHFVSSLAVGEQNILALLGVRKINLPLAKTPKLETPAIAAKSDLKAVSA